jgi:uncharacterized repeat protein (TIGR03803 family)
MLQREADYYAWTRRFLTVAFTLITALLFLASASQPAHSQSYKVIHNFTGRGSDGATPYGGPILDRSGNLYGTTYLGGSYGNGSVYRLSHSGSQWHYRSLWSFKGIDDGAGPAFGSLAMGADGTLFGTTEGGRDFGTAFVVCDCPWQEMVVHHFGAGIDGAQPIGGVVLDAAENLYGTTSLNGAYGNGTVFEAKREGSTWIESSIYNFTGGDDGTSPAATLSLDANGNVYGTTSFGGANNDGVVFEVSPSGSGWKQTVLYTFQGLDDGQNPLGGVVLDGAGNLYGTTFDGGVNGGGTVYKLSPSATGWTFTILYSLVGGYSGPYNKLTLDANGNIYGFTNSAGANGWGSAFKLTPYNGSWKFTDLYDFVAGNDGAAPYGSLAVDSDGNIFGTAVIGGTWNQGIVFEIMAGAE